MILRSSDLAHALVRTQFQGVGQRSEGKVRDVYEVDARTLAVISTDRISAFDRLVGVIPYRGQLLNQCAAWWFKQTQQIVPNHLLQVPDAAVSVVRRCRPFPVEFIMRGYLTGSSATSIWTQYQAGNRLFSGYLLPEGMRQHEPLPVPLLTPTTKAIHGAHDESLTREEIFERGLMNEADWEEATAAAQSLFAYGQRQCAARGLLLVDTKYEFGRDEDGILRLIDEVHTPDSSRFWWQAQYEEALQSNQQPPALDKEYLRRWLRDQGYQGAGTPPELPFEVVQEAFDRYRIAVETLCEMTAEKMIDRHPPIPRIARALNLE